MAKRKRNRKYGLKKKSRGSIAEYVLIIATIVAVAIVGLGYLGLVIQKQLGVLAGTTESETEVAEDTSIGDPPNASDLYYECKTKLQQIANAQYETFKEQTNALYDECCYYTWNYTSLSYDELYSLGSYTIDLFEDPPNASETYKNYKQGLLDIYYSSYDDIEGGYSKLQSYRIDTGYWDYCEETELRHLNAITNLLSGIFQATLENGIQ